MRPVKIENGLGRGLAPRLPVPLTLALLAEASWEVVFDNVVVDDDVVDVLRFFASSRGTYGPPASEHATPCRTQFEQGISSLHCECDQPYTSSRGAFLTRSETYFHMPSFALSTTLS